MGIKTLEEVLAGVPSLSGCDEAVPVLKKMLAEMQQQHGYKGFGVCGSCVHFEKLKVGQFRCGLTEESLSTDDSQKICREHSF